MKNYGLILLSLITLGCGDAQENISQSAILITDANIIDVRNGTLIEHSYVVVDSGKIKKITTSVIDPENYKTHLAGTGKYLLPGLAEMHAHIPSPPTSRERVEETLFLYLSNGITTIRGMLGHESHLGLREEVAHGELLGPRIFTSSPSLNGNTVSDPAEAVAKVRMYQEAGYDFLKIHPGIPLNAFDALVKTAGEVKISFSGHVPVDVGIRHALQSKYASIDHVDGFLEGLLPPSAKQDPNANGFFGYNFTMLADTSNISPLVELAKTNKVWIVPTQSLFERWFAPIDVNTLLQQPEMKYMPATTLKTWHTRKLETTGPSTNFKEENWQRFIAIRRQLIKELQQNGHGMLLGSDAPQLFNVPGFSIHHEIAGMSRAGLSPLEILQSGTINPAIFFGKEDTFGEIKEGLDADFLLLDANPLSDLAALQKISGVMVRGKWLDRAYIDQRLSEIAAHAATQ